LFFPNTFWLFLMSIRLLLLLLLAHNVSAYFNPPIFVPNAPVTTSIRRPSAAYIPNRFAGALVGNRTTREEIEKGGNSLE
jgi:hypothetical protein